MIVPAFAIPLSDRTGLKNEFPISSGNQTYTVETVANFDVQDVTFKDNHLVFSIVSSLHNNLGEIQIPNDITSGNLTFSLDGKEITPKILHNNKISFITLEFAGNGTHTLDVSSNYVQKPAENAGPQNNPSHNVLAIDHSNDTLIVVAVVGIVAAGGAGTTLAVYFKRKKA